MVEKASPDSPLVKNCRWAFFTGGSICVVGELLYKFYMTMGFIISDARLMASITLVALSALFTGLGWYGRLAKKAGAGTLVPITGFANAVVSPAMEFRSEGLITGTASKMFIIAGPVIVYGVLAAMIYGLFLYFQTVLGWFG
ncbi:MAG: SpoVA/SpoVAEb family sporulation membrane protein [Oscillospiraceae bacterium]|nr:SpoVA/SpoVAEb family sporulation membrane protein [Oscillospiraceae bacterium]